jgi:hypothetical protein
LQLRQLMTWYVLGGSCCCAGTEQQLAALFNPAGNPISSRAAAHCTPPTSSIHPSRQTADLLESVTCLALRSRLRECGGVTASICCDAWSLLQGRVNGVRLTGEGWRSPLNLTARHLEATVGEAVLDITAVLLQRRIVLTNVPVGTARVVFDAPDLGNFLVHPLMAAAAATAAFAFDQHSVRIAPPSVAQPEGAVEFTGTWRSDGQRYSVRLLPVAGGAGGASTGRGRGVQAHAVPLSSGARASESRGGLYSHAQAVHIVLLTASFAFC